METPQYEEMKNIVAVKPPPIIRIAKAKEIGRPGRAKYGLVPCADCGKERWVNLRHGIPYRLYCVPCAAKRRGQRMRGHNHPSWKGGRTINNKGYVLVLAPEHPRASHGYALEHILVWEQVHNQPLPKGWIIHHLNGIKTDNRPENLIALPSRKHQHVLAAKAQRIRELEAKLKILERALDQNQLIYWGEN